MSLLDQEKAIGEGAASVVVKGPGLQGLAKKLRLSTKKRAYERLLVKVQHIGHSITMG